MHLMRLMTSWAVVCDVYYLEPQTRREGETVIEFAERVQTLICDRINIKKVPWDGYLKYYRPSPKLTEKRQQKFAESILKRLDAPLTPTGRASLL
jgi:glycerol-3-phosphate O-acyltransferase 3/4